MQRVFSKLCCLMKHSGNISPISEARHIKIRKLITFTEGQKIRSQVFKFLICCLVVYLCFSCLDQVQMSGWGVGKWMIPTNNIHCQ